MSPCSAISRLRLIAQLAGIFILLTMLLVPSAAFSADPTPKSMVTLANKNFYRNLSRDVRYYEDRVKTLTPQTALQLDPVRDFQPIPGQLIDFGFSYSAFWLRVRLRNGSDEKGKWLLTLDVPNIKEIDVYLERQTNGADTSPEKVFSLTDSEPFAARAVAHRNLATPIQLEGGEQAIMLVRYVSKLSTQLPLYLESPDRYYARVSAEDTHNWSVLTLLAGMTLVSTIFLFALGFSTAGFYGSYILASAFYLFHTDGYAFQFLWPELPSWNNQAIAVIGMAMVITGSLFARSFTNAKQFHPLLNRVLLTTVGIAFLLACVSLIGLGYQSFKTGTLLFVVWAAILYLLAGILAARRRQAGSAFFICGASAVISSIIFGAVGYLNPGMFNQDVAGHFGRYALLVEGTAFALAILINILSLRSERDLALRREVQTAKEKLALSEALVSAQQSHSRAVALAERRRERLAATAHDLQQPLSSLRIAVSRLGEREDVAARQVHASFDYLDRLVSTGLEESHPTIEDDHHSHLAHGATQHDSEEFPIAVVLENVAAMFRDEAGAKGIDLRLVKSQALVRTQPLVLMRAVSNLVSNGVKYTEEGKVVFGCRRRGDDICIEVHDTGPGMTQETIARLMRPYERASDLPGTGLGLSLVRELSETSGYDFKLTASPGAGTCARLSLPRIA